MSDLKAQLMATLGVTESRVPIQRTPNTKVPRRPDELYTYTIDYVRTEYGTVTVHAADHEAANDQVWDTDIDWNETGETDVSGIEKLDDDPVNQDELDAWDEVYGRRYDWDGDPKCSECESVCCEEDLVFPDDDDSVWFCSDCRN